MPSKEKPREENRLQRIEKNPPSSTETEGGYVDKQEPIEWSDKDLAEIKRPAK